MGTRQKTVYCCDECNVEVENKDFDLDSKVLCSTCASRLLSKLAEEGCTVSSVKSSSIDKYNKWVDVVNFYQNHKLKMRLGQCYMNALADIDKSMYNKYSCTEWDCFYDDKKCEAFVNKLMKDWEI